MTSDELIYGIHAVTAILDTKPQQILQLFIQQGRHDNRLQYLIEIANKHQITLQEVTRKKMDEMVAQTNHQGVIARCRRENELTEDDLENFFANLTEPPFILVLDNVQDPHNLGACLRTANAAGVQLVLAPKDNSVGITPVVRKVACGAAEITPFITVTNLARTLRWLKDQGVWLFGAAGEATLPLFKADLRGSLALVLGAEEKGLRHLTRELCDHLIAIPMQGQVESLNVSVATGICLYEAVRQRIKV